MLIGLNLDSLIIEREKIKEELDFLKSPENRKKCWNIPIIEAVAQYFFDKKILTTENKLEEINRQYEFCKQIHDFADQHIEDDPSILDRNQALLAAKSQLLYGLNKPMARTAAHLSRAFKDDQSATEYEAITAAKFQIDYPKLKPHELMRMARLCIHLQIQFNLNPRSAYLMVRYHTDESLPLREALGAAKIQIEYEDRGIPLNRKVILIANKLVHENMKSDLAVSEAQQLLSRPESHCLTVDEAYLVIKLSLRKSNANTDENRAKIIEKVKKFDHFSMKKTDKTKNNVKDRLGWKDKLSQFFGLSKWVLIRTGNENGKIKDLVYINIKRMEELYNKNHKSKIFDASAIQSTYNSAENSFQLHKLMEEANDRLHPNYLFAGKANGILNKNRNEDLPIVKLPLQDNEERRLSVDSDQTVIQSSERSDEDQEIISPSDESLSPKSGSQASMDRVEPNNNPIARLLEQINQSFRKQPGMSGFTDEEFSKIILPFFFGILSLEDDGLTGLTQPLTAPQWISDLINKQFTPKILANQCTLQRILDLGMVLKSELDKFNLKEMDFESYYDSDSYKTGNNLISRVKYEIEQSERGRIDRSPSPVSSPAPAGFIPSHHMHPTFDTRRLRKLWF